MLSLLSKKTATLGAAARSAARAMSTSLDSLNALRFDDAKLQAAVSAETYAAYHSAIKSGSAVPDGAAQELADALRDWAVGNGAVQFSHIFYPRRQLNSGQKSDAFVDLDFGSSNPLKPIVGDTLSGDRLWMAETDGSSFPNGGLRVTHTAAAYMIFDKSSPPYIYKDTLYLPSAFVSWEGNALDYKAPLLRSQEAVNTSATRLCRNLGFADVDEVYANVGWEQEYFAIPRELNVARPDLVNTERTILGAAPPRGQQLSIDYFGKMQPRIKAFNMELQEALWELGMASSVYHNEVAPAQYELSPIFALTNVAADQNQLCAEVMKDIGLKHDLAILLHEKPFRGINGSGKHCNWGLNTDTGKNLYVPGKTAEEQGRFVAFTAAMMHGVGNYAEMYRVSVAGAGNDHRLGADEAPPAIFTMAPGKTYTAHLESIVAGGELAGYSGARYGENMVDTGARATGTFGASTEDRNRTAPLPFCGNRFEFRAVGSNDNISLACMVMNTTVAEGCDAISDLIEGGQSPRDAVAQVIESNMDIVFNGNGYGSEWHQEAEFERGLPNLKTTVMALGAMNSEKNQALFAKHGVYKPEELAAGQSLMYDRYVNEIQVEADTMLNMINQGVLPACAQDLALYEGNGLAGARQATYAALGDATAALQGVVDAWPDDDEVTAAEYAANAVKPAMEACRDAHDAAEKLIAKDLYPYPNYEDLLFPHQYE